MKNIISIIVPIYNVEQYLDCCIQSILAQSILPDGKTIFHGDSRRVYTWESCKYEYNRHMAHITVWGALYRKEIIEGIQFSEDLYDGEDSVFLQWWCAGQEK